MGKYGGAVYYREFLADVVLLSDPRALQHVLASDGNNYPRDAKARKYATTLFPADNLSTTEGLEHDKLRKMFNPYFGLSQIKAFLPLFEQCTLERLLPILEKAAQSKEIVNMKAELANFTLAVIGQVSFSYDFDANPAVHAAFVQLFTPPSMSMILGMTYIPGYESLPFEEPSRRRAAKKALFGAMEEVVQHKLASKNASNDMMDLFLPKSTRLQAISYAIQMTAAGHETSSSTLAFVVAEAFHRSDVVAAMRAECHQVLEKHGTFASWEATQELSYTTAVVQETLRLRTVVQKLHRRVAVKDDRIPMSDGSTIFIPKGTAIEMFTSAMHRNPRYWTTPDDFIPERFLPGTPEWKADEILRGGSSHTFNYLPFSFGSKNCIGQRFAMAEVVIALAWIVTEFDLQVDPKCNTRVKFNGFTSGPAELFVKVKRLESSLNGVLAKTVLVDESVKDGWIRIHVKAKRVCASPWTNQIPSYIET
ncbi:unnamed protein product [Aphanomyces euteiches]